MKKTNLRFYIRMNFEENNIVELEIQLDQCNALLMSNPNEKKLYFSRGTIKMKMSDSHGAIIDFMRVIELDPHVPVVYLYKGYAEMMSGNIIGSIDDYD